jgi:hypothetical protein
MSALHAFSATAAAAGAGAALLLAAPQAQADPIGTVGVRETVCAQTL